MAEYRLSDMAERDLEGIWLFTNEQWGADQADRYVDALTAVMGALAITPGTAPPCDHIRNGYRKRSVGRHAIYFRITDYGIAVIRILHDRMNAADHI